MLMASWHVPDAVVGSLLLSLPGDVLSEHV